MENTRSKSGNKTRLISLLKQVRTTITSWFRPEVVEVTFEENEGKVVSYTYTVVDHKNVA